MKNSKRATALAAVAALLMMADAGHAASPTQADFDLCNKEAQARATSPAASPGLPGTSGPTPSPDMSRTGPGTADTARGPVTTPTTPSAPLPSTPPTPPAGSSGGGTTSIPSPGTASDSQLTGMAAAGQSDPAYQQAYRECLKRRGF